MCLWRPRNSTKFSFICFKPMSICTKRGGFPHILIRPHQSPSFPRLLVPKSTRPGRALNLFAFQPAGSVYSSLRVYNANIRPCATTNVLCYNVSGILFSKEYFHEWCDCCYCIMISVYWFNTYIYIYIIGCYAIHVLVRSGKLISTFANLWLRISCL